MKKYFRKAVAVYVAAAAFCFVFQFIYGMFGHGVHSAYMTYMFLLPLLLGAGGYGGGTLLHYGIEKKNPAYTALQQNRQLNNLERLGCGMYNAGVATLTAGSCLLGIFQIAGTDSVYINDYFIAGALLCAAGLVIFICACNKACNGSNLRNQDH